MKPLVTQKIEFGVRLKNDEIVGERQSPGKEMVVVWGKEKSNALAQHSLRRPAYAALCYGSRPIGVHAFSPSLSLQSSPIYSPYEDKDVAQFQIHNVLHL